MLNQNKPSGETRKANSANQQNGNKGGKKPKGNHNPQANNSGNKGSNNNQNNGSGQYRESKWWINPDDWKKISFQAKKSHFKKYQAHKAQYNNNGGNNNQNNKSNNGQRPGFSSSKVRFGPATSRVITHTQVQYPEHEDDDEEEEQASAGTISARV